MKVKCYSVKLSSIKKISSAACIATTEDGSEDIFPISQIFGLDEDFKALQNYWIAAWILQQKTLTYSGRKRAWFDKQTRKKIITKRYKK